MSTNLEAPARPRPGLVSVDGLTYPLESAALAARAEGGLALSRLTQTFANPHERALEVVYTMPLPAEGAVVGYTIRIGERVIRGVVEPRERAQATYEAALAQGRSAGLLEQDRDDTFQQRLGNIPPKTKVEVEIEVLQRLAALAALDANGPLWEYRFPTVVGVRYEGGPGRVPDARRLDLDRDADGGIPTRLEIDATVADPTAAQVTSPSHTILREASADGARVRFGAGERLDRDLVLRWPACAAESGARLLIGGGLAGDEGRYGLVTVTPPHAPRAALPRDLTVLIDASGSMTGEPIEYAKEVVKELLQSLEPGDRFELLAFAMQVQSLTGGMREAMPDALRDAHAALRALNAGGGTEMANAIQEALKPLRHGAQRQVVLVTDGQIGFEHEVVAGIMNGLPEGSRVHAVGIGAAPNRSLTANVARAGRGVELLVSDPVTAREAARRLRTATVRPVITSVSIEGAGLLRAATLRLRDVFAGQPLLAAVELKRQGGTLEVRGRLAGSAEPWVRRIAVPAASAPAADAGVTLLPIGALFGREAIADLELTIAASRNAAAEIDEQIEALGMRHRIVSRRTSLVAIAEEPGVDPKAPKRTERLAVEMPAGVSAQAFGLLAADAQRLYRGIHRAVLFARPQLQMRSMPSGEVAGAAPPIARLADMQALFADARPPAQDLRDSLERLQHELEALPPAMAERLARIRVAAEELALYLKSEHERWERVGALMALAAAENKALRRRALELLKRLQSHIDQMRKLAERVARSAREREANPLAAGAGQDDLRAALEELTRGGLAQEHTALVDELHALVKTELPPVR